MAGGEPIAVRRFDDYLPKLEAAKVVLDHERRQAIIEAEAKNLAFAQGLEVVEDKGLLEEVAGLVEWPVVLMGTFDEKFLEIPEEVVRLTIRQNQKCFVVRGAGALDPSRRPAGAPQGEGVGGGDTSATSAAGGTPLHSPHPEVRAERASKDEGSSSGRLANRFLLVSNIEASDGGKEIVAGNERVIAARLSDARFFWEQDLKVPLEEHAKKLRAITFHEKLGSQAERVERIARLARELAPDCRRRSRRCGACGAVGEGRSHDRDGRRISRAAGRDGALLRAGCRARKPSVADAIRDHYKPQGPNDSCRANRCRWRWRWPTSSTRWWASGRSTRSRPGAKDPYALRRAALGVIRIVFENEIRVPTSCA